VQQLSTIYGAPPIITPLQGNTRPTISARWSAPRTIADLLQRLQTDAASSSTGGLS
jgi:hypothetical protein